MAEGAGATDLPSRPGELVSRLEQLEARVAALEQLAARIATLEEHGSASARVAAGAEPAEALVAPELPSGTLALVGRTLLVLAGAYVVRALTDGRVLPPAVGVALGIAYAAVWQLLADRDAGKGRISSAALHDVASSLIAFPLVFEACARFGLLTPKAAAVAIVAFFALGLAVARHRRLVANAVVTTTLALLTALALLASTHDLLSALLALGAIAAGLEWLAFRGAWLGLRWPAAAVLDLAALLLVAVATRPALPEGYAPLSPAAAVAALLAIPLLYAASIGARTLYLGQGVRVFEAVQGSAAVLLGAGGAVRVLATHALPVAVPVALTLLVGLLCYAAAFAYAERRAASDPRGGSHNFYFYSTAGGLLTAASTGLAGMGPALPIAWMAVGLAAALLGRLYDRMTLRVHGALFLVAAAAQAGLISACAGSLGGLPASPTPVAWAAAAAAAVAWAALASDPSAPRAGARRAPQLALAIVLTAAAAKLAHAAACLPLGDRLAGDPAAAAVVSTAVLALLALGLAYLARRGASPELGWLVYPLVALGGMKLLLEDLRHGRPATLVLSLALYGLVLTAAPRLLKTAGRDRA